MRGKNKGRSLKKSPKSAPVDSPSVLSSTPVADGLRAQCLSSEFVVPRPICSEMVTLPFADTAEPSMIADMISFISMSSRAMYQLDDCIMIDIGGMLDAWFAPLLTDAAFFNGVCMTVGAYLRESLGRRHSSETQQADHIHYAKTIRMLQARITSEDDEIRLSDTTIMTVLCMLGHAYTSGDLVTAEKHCHGLLKLVSMRGVKSLLRNTRLCVEIIRCDLYTANDSMSTPILLTLKNIPWPLRSYDIPMQQMSLTALCQRFDPELAAIWVAMAGFSAQVNAASHDAGPRISEEHFLESMTSIMYRLLLRRYPIGSIDEAFRLGLIAFSSPVFLHWNRVELPDEKFIAAYRHAIMSLRLKSTNIEPHELVWLLMVAAVSKAHELKSLEWLIPWLKIILETCYVQTWYDLKSMLHRVMWIDLVYDSVAQDMFDTVMKREAGDLRS
ncbi:unnamed protein product [Periconia digitata]|uniref:Uncharacterized protein n=1 Tax=Periconia digitata TaxID=1303443 RepID=A0A9W4XZ52_9PLEO|nr:unnamed protein product [Periconia digitata]